MDLPEKDRAILQAAIASKAAYLLTGDIRHFGEWFGKTIETVTVLLPAVYFHETMQSFFTLITAAFNTSAETKC
jgi:predicted nucleic acid-binding protein